MLVMMMMIIIMKISIVTILTYRNVTIAAATAITTSGTIKMLITIMTNLMPINIINDDELYFCCYLHF
jgi:hypothetical protein